MMEISMVNKEKEKEKDHGKRKKKKKNIHYADMRFGSLGNISPSFG